MTHFSAMNNGQWTATSNRKNQFKSINWKMNHMMVLRLPLLSTLTFKCINYIPISHIYAVTYNRWPFLSDLQYNSTYVVQKLIFHFGFSFESVSLFDDKFQFNKILFFRMTFSWEKNGQNGRHHFPSLLRYKRYETVSNTTIIYKRSDWEINRYFIIILI